MSKKDHPDFESLFRYSEGTLPENQRATIEHHLEICGPCHLEVARMRDAQAGSNEPEPPPVSDLQERLTRWRGSVVQPDSGEGLKQRVVVELTPYLGGTAACEILKRVASTGENLLGVLDAVLRPVLGKSAASLLISRIVDRAVMRT
jgi:hypothetical protein